MKKRKIGTLSLNINTPDFNYGAILHSWAFQKYLEKNTNADVEIIDYKTPHLERFDKAHPIKSYIKMKNWKSLAKRVLKYNSYMKKYNKFEEFIKNNIKFSKKKYTQSTLNTENLEYDTLICESDVIWSPGFFKGIFDKTFFLALDSMNDKKRIAYAPSMADGNMTDDNKRELKDLLCDLDYISCRESYEKRILENYTEKEITHVLDPVMLLSAEDYDRIIAPKILKEEYLLIYLPVNNNKKLRKEAIKYAKRNNLKILEITTNLISHTTGVTLTSAGVEEFLSAIKNAKIVFTNSFHAICFSIIFNREFYAFSRACNGKVKDICELMGLEGRFLSNDIFIELEKINYTEVNSKWNDLKVKSQRWINNALDY